MKLNRTLIASFKGWREQGCVWLLEQSDNKNISKTDVGCVLNIIIMHAVGNRQFRAISI